MWHFGWRSSDIFLRIKCKKQIAVMMGMYLNSISGILSNKQVEAGDKKLEVYIKIMLNNGIPL
jgi:hypothetical protein